jgi:predicted phosphoadenosine phosphosulfate sulfurtransferase
MFEFQLSNEKFFVSVTEWKNKKKEKGPWLLLGMVEEDVYYRYVGEHSQRQEHLGEHRVNMTRLSCAM